MQQRHFEHHVSDKYLTFYIGLSMDTQFFPRVSRLQLSGHTYLLLVSSVKLRALAQLPWQCWEEREEVVLTEVTDSA